MKKLVSLSFAALFLAACSESTAPTAANLASAKPAATSVATTSTYSDDFNSPSASSSVWSIYRVNSLPSTSNYPSGGAGYLGPFTNEALTLSYTYIAGANLTFDLYIIGTWDGAAGHKYGADTWEVAATCGSTVAYDFETSFSNKRTTKQNYPAPVGGALYPGRTQGLNTYDLGFSADPSQNVTNTTVSSYSTIYQLSVPSSALAACAGQTITFTFHNPSQELQGVSDESWGLDNVSY